MSVTERLARPLPLTLEEIDHAWLSAALATRAPEATLRGFEVLEVIHGTCTKVRMQLDLDDAGRRAGVPERLMLKGGFEPHSQAMDYMHRAEVRGYRDVLPVLGLPSPACWFADFDPERRQGIILMEDLTARGVSFCHPLKPQRPDEVARRLSVLASFHAQTWGSAELEPGGRWGWPDVIIPEEGGHLRHFLQPEIWRSFVELPRGRAASVYFQDQRWMADALERLVRLAARLPHAVLHGDTHLGNLYVEPDGTPGAFDSLPHRWPAIAEVAYHTACALDPMDRRRWERELVGSYLEELAGHGVAAPPLDVAMTQYAAFLALGFCIFMINDPVFQPEPINTAYTARFSTAMIDNDTVGVLAAIR